MGNKPTRENALTWEKRMQHSFPSYPLLHAVKFCQVISGDAKETDKSASHVKSLGICKASGVPGAYLSLSAVADIL